MTDELVVQVVLAAVSPCSFANQHYLFLYVLVEQAGLQGCRSSFGVAIEALSWKNGYRTRLAGPKEEASLRQNDAMEGVENNLLYAKRLYAYSLQAL